LYERIVLEGGAESAGNQGSISLECLMAVPSSSDSLPGGDQVAGMA